MPLGNLHPDADPRPRRNLVPSVMAIALSEMATTHPSLKATDPSPAPRRRRPELDPEVPVEVESKIYPRTSASPIGEGADTMVVTRFQDGTTFIEVFDGVSSEPLTCIRHGHSGPYDLIAPPRAVEG